MQDSEEVKREKGMSTHGACLWICVCVRGRKHAVTNMFVSMRRRETALSRLPLWVVYKKICHIFLNPHHQPPCSTQPLVTPDWSCNVFPLVLLVSLSLHMLLWDLGRLQTQQRRERRQSGKERDDKNTLKDKTEGAEESERKRWDIFKGKRQKDI